MSYEEDIDKVLCSGIEKMALNREIIRLKQLVKDAYMEAYYNAPFITDGYEQINQCWESSQAKRELEIDPNITWVTLG